jgi:transposase
MVHVGIDLRKRTSRIAVLSADGELTQHRLPNDAARLELFLPSCRRRAPSQSKPSGTRWWLVDLLERLGHQPVLSHPKETKPTASARLKNDKVDAQRLALLLRGDLLPTVWIPPAALREARELIRHRVGLIWLRTQIGNRLLAMLELLRRPRSRSPDSSRGAMAARGKGHLIPSTFRPAGFVGDGQRVFSRVR